MVFHALALEKIAAVKVYFLGDLGDTKAGGVRVEAPPPGRFAWPPLKRRPSENG
jgi:hypothetical protein